MKWLKINTVKQITENGRFVARKVFAGSWALTDNSMTIEEQIAAVSKHSFSNLKELKKYVEEQEA